MGTRERWEEVSFQVFTDEGGVLRSGWYPTGEGTVTGEVQVDRVWGNMPMQPNTDRSYDEFSFGGGAGDNGWDNTWSERSDTLDQGTLENNRGVGYLFNINPEISTDHVNVVEGYSNFPKFIPNYDGLKQYDAEGNIINNDTQDDGAADEGLETVVPDLIRKTRNQAEALLEAADLDWFGVAHNLEIQYLESTGTTVRVWAYNESWNTWGGYSNAALNGLRRGDEVNLSITYDGDPLLVGGNKVVTNLLLDGSESWFEFESATELFLDGEASGTVVAGDNLIDVVTLQRSNHAAGSIKNEGFEVHFRYFND